jgi:hypothetical protein
MAVSGSVWPISSKGVFGPNLWEHLLILVSSCVIQGNQQANVGHHIYGLATYDQVKGIGKRCAVRRDRSPSVPRGIAAASAWGTTSEDSVIEEQQQIAVCSRCIVEVHRHNRSERALSPLVHGRLRNLK